jgi:phage gp45-like
MARATAENLRDRAAGALARLRNVIRRLEVVVATGSTWRLEGVEDDEGNVEAQDAEPFLGGALYRPAAGAKVQAVVALVGAESGHPVVVALRDEATRAAVEAALGIAAGEAALFGPSGAVVYFKSDGTIEARDKSGTAQRLVTEADFAALRTWLAAHVHPDPASGFTGAPTTSTPSPTYTTKLKGE